MSDSQVAFRHVLSQVQYEWLPPPVWDEQTTVAGRFSIPPDWCRAGHWLDIAASDLNLMAVVRSRAAKAAAEHFTMLCAAGGHYVPFWHADYPEALRFIADPPIALSALGTTEWLPKAGVAVIGSRKASGRAVEFCEEVGCRLAGHGLVVVSGGALGCDIAAHRGALAAMAAKVPAVVVFAGGLVEPYPLRNRHVFNRIVNNGGVLVSERLWSAPSRPMDFPVRNRIISGMSRLVVVAQAAERSGAYITAKLALDHSREVVVYRHPEGDVRARGSCALIDEGAQFVDRADQLVCPVGSIAHHP